MTAKEFRAALSKLRMSQADMARHMGVSEGAVSLWVNGHRPISGPVSRLVEQMLARGSNAEHTRA